MKYCKSCILPDSRPGIFLDENGVCSGCLGHLRKDNEIKWDQRKKEFKKIVKESKKKSSGYDCIVPVSGGKDSWYQIITAKENGLKILALTWKTPARTKLGYKNLERMLNVLNVDHIDYSFSRETEKKFLVAAFEKTGVPGLPMHLAIFSMCTRMAIQLRIPLIIWGENSQLEYGGNKKEQLSTDLDSYWIRNHGCMEGKSAKDWIGINGLTEKDLVPYHIPSNLKFVPKSIFLGSFIKWNSFKILEKVKKYGFMYEENKAKVGYWDFADIDCNFISLHHFPKWYKFGMSRIFDNLSIQIRYGMINRDEAIEILKKKGHQIPHNDIDIFCKFVDKPVSWFWDTCEKYRNKEIWYKDKKIWKIKNFLIKDWNWIEN
jgi:N-acetyl sugar amidotransferase